MRSRVLSVLFLTLFLSPFSNAENQTPEVIGVLFYADWCGSCKVLDPNLEKARTDSDLDNDSILFVTLDLTDSTTKHQSELMAHSLGLSEVYAKHEGTTGFMLLIDADSKEVITRLTKALDASEISDLISKAIAHVTT